MSLEKTNLVSVDSSFLRAGQRVIKCGDMLLPIGIGGNNLPSGGSSMNFYKCTSVDTVGKTWSGNMAILQDGVYTFESKVTSGLTYTEVIPAVGTIYSSDALIIVGFLWEGDTLNTDKTRFLLMPSRSNNEIKDIAKGGNSLVIENTKVTTNENGAMVFNGSDSFLKINTRALPTDILAQNAEWTFSVDFYNSGGDRGIFGLSDGSGGNVEFDAGSPIFYIQSFYSLPHITPHNVNRHIITFEQWKDESGKLKITDYLDGVAKDTRDIATDKLVWDGDLFIGCLNHYLAYPFAGNMYMIKLDYGALYKGQSFTPPYPIPEA